MPDCATSHSHSEGTPEENGSSLVRRRRVAHVDLADAEVGVLAADAEELGPRREEERKERERAAARVADREAREEREAERQREEERGALERRPIESSERGGNTGQQVGGDMQAARQQQAASNG